LVRQGKLVLLGVTQEQHPDRCRLFAQWQQFDWPILHDPINVLRLRGVPIVVALDEQGIVRAIGPDADSLEADFVNQRFTPEAADPSTQPPPAQRPDLAALERHAEQAGSSEAWRELGDGLAIWEGPDRIDEAIGAYRKAIAIDPGDGLAQFRLGVCYRIRYESPSRRSGDFQAAVDHWSAARAVDPNQYIWRRRIEQYGPRLTKPYPFYDWVATAVAEVAARGERPVPLPTEPTGAEIAYPEKSFADDDRKVASPDPDGRINRDTDGLIDTDVAVVPPRIKPGDSARIHVTLRPDARSRAHWNNEAQPLVLWIDAPPGWQIERRLLTAPPGDRPETTEPRHLEFEVHAPPGAAGPAQFQAYALYYVCEETGGTCQYLRQDIPIVVQIND
jgi:hypothetical protein